MTLPAEFSRKLVELFDLALQQHAGPTERGKLQLRKRLVELERQEDRYIELAVDPDWAKAKLVEKLRDIRDERARLKRSLNDTGQELVRGHAIARRMLDYLERPHVLQAARADRAKREPVAVPPTSSRSTLSSTATPWSRVTSCLNRSPPSSTNCGKVTRADAQS